MAKKFVLAVPNVPPDEMFEVEGLGVFSNGTYDLTDEQVAVWESRSGYRWPSQGTLTLPATTDAKPLVPINEPQGRDTVIENPLAAPVELGVQDSTDDGTKVDV